MPEDKLREGGTHGTEVAVDKLQDDSSVANDIQESVREVIQELETLGRVEMNLQKTLEKEGFSDEEMAKLNSLASMLEKVKQAGKNEGLQAEGREALKRNLDAVTVKIASINLARIFRNKRNFVSAEDAQTIDLYLRDLAVFSQKSIPKIAKNPIVSINTRFLEMKSVVKEMNKLEGEENSFKGNSSNNVGEDGVNNNEGLGTQEIVEPVIAPKPVNSEDDPLSEKDQPRTGDIKPVLVGGGPLDEIKAAGGSDQNDGINSGAVEGPTPVQVEADPLSDQGKNNITGSPTGGVTGNEEVQSAPQPIKVAGVSPLDGNPGDDGDKGPNDDDLGAIIEASIQKNDKKEKKKGGLKTWGLILTALAAVGGGLAFWKKDDIRAHFSPHFEPAGKELVVKIDELKQEGALTIRLTESPSLVLAADGTDVTSKVKISSTKPINIEELQEISNLQPGKLFVPVAYDLDGNDVPTLADGSTEKVYVLYEPNKWETNLEVDAKNLEIREKKVEIIKEHLSSAIDILVSNGDESQEKEALITAIQKFMNETGEGTIDSLSNQEIANLLRENNFLPQDLGDKFQKYLKVFSLKKSEERIDDRIKNNLNPENFLKIIRITLNLDPEKLEQRTAEIAQKLIAKDFDSKGLKIGKGDAYYDKANGVFIVKFDKVDPKVSHLEGIQLEVSKNKAIFTKGGVEVNVHVESFDGERLSLIEDKKEDAPTEEAQPSVDNQKKN